MLQVPLLYQLDDLLFSLAPSSHRVQAFAGRVTASVGSYVRDTARRHGQIGQEVAKSLVGGHALVPAGQRRSSLGVPQPVEARCERALLPRTSASSIPEAYRDGLARRRSVSARLHGNSDSQ